jgi:hypothetical protein
VRLFSVKVKSYLNRYATIAGHSPSSTEILTPLPVSNGKTTIKELTPEEMHRTTMHESISATPALTTTTPTPGSTARHQQLQTSNAKALAAPAKFSKLVAVFFKHFIKV